VRGDLYFPIDLKPFGASGQHFVSTQPTPFRLLADRSELFSKMCLNAAVSNLDDHPHNHAVLPIGRNWRLSPAFDLTPSLVISRKRRDLAMVLGAAGRFANRKNLLCQHGRFLPSEEEAAGIVDGIVPTVRKSWRPTMRQ
jgi:serine/threonine-protein kinase HipA